MPEEVVKERFDRLLKRVQEISAEKTQAGAGVVEDVLVEDVNKQETGYVTREELREIIWYIFREMHP